MTDVAANLTQQQRALLLVLNPIEWRKVNYRLGPFNPWTANELVHLGMAERRPRPKKAGAFKYRQPATAAK